MLKYLFIRNVFLRVSKLPSRKITPSPLPKAEYVSAQEMISSLKPKLEGHMSLNFNGLGSACQNVRYKNLERR